MEVRGYALSELNGCGRAAQAVGLWKNLARFHKLQGDAAPLGTLLHGGDIARHQSGVHVVPWSVF